MYILHNDKKYSCMSSIYNITYLNTRMKANTLWFRNMQQIMIQKYAAKYVILKYTGQYIGPKKRLTVHIPILLIQ